VVLALGGFFANFACFPALVIFMNYSFLLRHLPLLALLATACTAPRTFTSSGKVTPRGEFRVGGNTAFNVATETLSKAGSTLKEAATAAARKDTVAYSGAVDRLQTAALAYVLDPVQPTADLYIRYGLTERVDAGYKYAFGSHVFDAMYQFMGPTGTPESPGGRAGEMYGSIGLQFATQRAKLPSIPFLNNITDLLSFSANRNDLIVPLVFSKSFGPEEEIGALSFGVVYAHTFVRYGFESRKIYVPQTNNLLAGLNQRQNFGSFGGFINAKIGFRYAYVIPAVSLFYQNYGTYQLLNNRTATLKGVTVVPSIGLQFRVPSSRR
jgi:hypothetical protein